ncbi:IS66 family insertion sequence element accessory protein TnpB [Photobacterium leiognathi]|uniref:IS66 family insertion sequence element accessory protein TnpB n=1 Tax=Photobacterium leiognathi TaxID=553611 RepID=UPI0027387502|nr:IS66 family insertion sequence element accessory protein TnpB [Photobacterium leiognathi]
MKLMLTAPDIYLYRECVDFRKSINGLAAIIENNTDLPLGTGALFLFTNKQRDKIKILYWDKTGFALWYKRLEKAKYKWPSKRKSRYLRYHNMNSTNSFLGSPLLVIRP